MIVAGVNFYNEDFLNAAPTQAPELRCETWLREAPAGELNGERRSLQTMERPLMRR